MNCVGLIFNLPVYLSNPPYNTVTYGPHQNYYYYTRLMASFTGQPWLPER